MRKIIILTLCILCLSGCAKLEHTEEMMVQAEIVDVDHTAMWMQPVKCGKVTTYITHPAQYDVTLRYQDVETIIDSQALYNECKGKIGSTIEVILITRYYDNNTVKMHLECK